MKRLRFGPDVTTNAIHTPPAGGPPPVVKLDVNITIHGVQTDRSPVSVTFSPDAYSVETHTPLNLVHFVAVGTGQARPSTPEEYFVGGYIVHTIDVGSITDGSPVEASLPNLAPETDYTILTVLEDDPA